MLDVFVYVCYAIGVVSLVLFAALFVVAIFSLVKGMWHFFTEEDGERPPAR